MEKTSGPAGTTSTISNCTLKNTINTTPRNAKLAAGRRFIAPCLRGEWNAYAGKHQRMTWFDVCAFICNQGCEENEAA
jgi:hypothetical protein